LYYEANIPEFIGERFVYKYHDKYRLWCHKVMCYNIRDIVKIKTAIVFGGKNEGMFALLWKITGSMFHALFLLAHWQKMLQNKCSVDFLYRSNCMLNCTLVKTA
jgi:hypothetical protein